jgi:two-component system, chemotaxis family, chemotaxis protein CheY
LFRSRTLRLQGGLEVGKQEQDSFRSKVTARLSHFRGEKMTPFSVLSVLVVDDSPTIVQIVRRLLACIGSKNVDNSANGLDALMKINEKKYDLVLADWNMEPMNGYELLKQVRSDPRFSKTVVILMTADAKAEQVIAAKKAGAYYIGKPFTVESLKQKIEASFLASDPKARQVLS